MIEALLRDVDIPEIPGDEDYVMDESRMEEFTENVASIREGKSPQRWLTPQEETV